MKNYFYIITIFLFTVFNSCSNEEGFEPSQIDTSTPELTELDVYIRQEFTTPYNIEVEYEFDINEVDQNRFLYPPRIPSVKPILDLLKNVWIEPHNKVGGANFIKNIAPRQFTLIGSYNFNQSATITLGLAEAGTKITLFNIDFIDYTNIESIKQPLKTIQHEYGHILNQNEAFTTAYGNITPGTYSSQWNERSEQAALNLGYITPYASSRDTEDFVEMVSEMLTQSPEEFEALIASAGNADARAALRSKQALVKEYYLTEYQINFDELQAIAYQAMLDIVN